MSDYGYYKGEIPLKNKNAKKVYEQLLETEYGQFINDDLNLTFTLEENILKINTIDGGSFPMSFFYEFEKTLEANLKNLSKKVEIDYFLHPDGFHKLILDPEKTKLKYKFVSQEDPHEKLDIDLDNFKFKNYKTSDLINKILETDKSLNKKNVVTTLKLYFEYVRELVKKGKYIKTPIGIVIKKKSLIKVQGNIFAFLHVDSVDKDVKDKVYTNSDLIDQIVEEDSNLQKDQVSKTLEIYFKKIREIIKNRDNVKTPIGTLCRKENIKDYKGDIVVFYHSDTVDLESGTYENYHDEFQNL